MTGHPRRHRIWVDDVDPDGLNVFIPGAVASGFLISMVLLIGDAIRNLTGGTGRLRRVKVTASAIAADVRAGPGHDRKIREGLRDDRVYGLIASLSLAVAVIAIPGATWNFLNPDGYIRQISWLWVLSMLGSLFLLALGVQVMRLVPDWLPRFLGVAGVAFTVRFAILVDAGTIPIVLAVGLGVSALLVRVSWRFRDIEPTVPPSVRNLAARTPLGSAGTEG